MRVLLAQLSPAPGEVGTNAATVCEIVRSHPEADLAVFPELFLGGYDPSRVAAVALERDHHALDAIRDVARIRATAVVVGFAERLPEGVANAVALIGADGSWAATYRKTHLFGEAERTVFVPGDALCVTELAGRRVGPLICYDAEFPEPARAVALAGAELLVTVAANMEPYAPDHALAARARALDNRRPHVYVNRVGEEAGMRFVGGSAAIAPDGSRLAFLGDAPAVATVELEIPSATGDPTDYVAHIRADLRVDTSLPSTTQGATR